MFGYLDIDKKKLQEGQRGLWQTFMCGLCFSTKKLFGNIPRMLITNDVNFFNVLFHSVLQIDVQLESCRCISHPLTKRPVQKPTELSDKLAIGNVLLTYLKLYDDVADGGGSTKHTALRAFTKTYKVAQKQWPQLDETLKNRYEQLRTLEKGNCTGIDQAAHYFAILSQDFCKAVLADKSTPYAETLCYNLGKWVYLVDALDDVKKDIKRRNYNPFVASYGANCLSDVVLHKDEISFLMFAVLNRIAQSFNDLELTKYNCILKNVLFDSIRGKTEQILAQLN